MGKGGVVGFAVTKRLQFRHLHDVAGRGVASPVAAVLNGYFRAGKETLHGVQRLYLRIERRHGCVKMRGQAVDLFGIENRIALHKRDFDFHVRAFVIGAALGERVGIDDKRTFLAFANLPAKFERLLVGQP